MFWCWDCRGEFHGRNFEYTCQTCNASMCAKCADKHREHYGPSTFSVAQIRETA